jgi:acyl-CoA hydrolase
MSTHTYIIRPEYLNHGGNLFGGQMLSWADEVAYITATLKFPQCEFVTKALEATDFKTPAANGHIIKITGEVIETGVSSCKVLVSATNLTVHQDVFSTHFIMVNVIDGKKAPIAAGA